MKDLHGPNPHHRRIPLHRIDWTAEVVEAGFCIATLARNCGYSVRSLQRHVSERFGVPLFRLVTAIRMKKAHELLQAGCAVKEVASEVGYKQPSHFARRFRAETGSHPSRVAEGEASLASENGSTR